MRAKLINEVQNFSRNEENTHVSLGVGNYNIIAKKMLEEIYNSEHSFLTYKINSLDNIEIFFTDRYRDQIRGAKAANPIYKWIVKFIALPQYIADPYEHKGSTWMDEDKIYKYWSVYKRSYYNGMWPNDNKINQEREIDLSKEDKNAEKKAKLIADAFNKEFDPIYGFELIETIKIPIEEI